MKYFIAGFRWFFYIEFYDKLNKQADELNKILNHNLNFLDLDKNEDFISANKLMEEYNKTFERLYNLSDEFDFEFTYAFWTSLFTSIILFLCLIFICSNYIGIDSYFSIAILSLYFYICLFIYRYWVKQTSIYYEQLI